MWGWNEEQPRSKVDKGAKPSGLGAFGYFAVRKSSRESLVSSRLELFRDDLARHEYGTVVYFGPWQLR